MKIHLGTADNGQAFSLPLEALRQHLIAIGGTGSGKTVFCKAVVEEAIRYRLPVIAVDMQGDLLSLANHSDALPEGAVPVSDVTRAKYRERCDVKIWTPASEIGIPVSFSPPMYIAPGLSVEERTRTIGGIARGLASVIGTDKKVTVSVFYQILDFANRFGIPMDSIGDFRVLLNDCPDVLGRQLDDLMSEKMRSKTAGLFGVAMTGEEGLNYSMGRPLDIREMFGQLGDDGPVATGRARLSIVYLNHLSVENQQRFLALLFSSLYQWMLTQGDCLSGLLYVDEIAAICPPVKKTPAKESLMLLLRQARKYGLCCLLATQTPGDVDYRAMSQCFTQAIGNVQGDTPVAKVQSLMSAWPNVNVDELLKRVKSASRGEFIVTNPNYLEAPTAIQARWLATEHRLVKPEDVAEMTDPNERETLG